MSRIPINGRDSMAFEHDNHPWIESPNNVMNYVGKAEKINGYGNRSGSFSPEITDNFNSISSIYWELLDNSFPYNLVRFSPNNVNVKDDGGFIITLKKQKLDERDFTSGALRSRKKFQYGRFEVEMKPSNVDGIITAFFLYRIDPWQEIDIEFLGNDTSKMLTNVYFNPGEEGTVQNYGTSGTPVSIDLGFDASTEFHHYAIEWDPNEIRWFVDDELIHVRNSGYPTPIPNLPMKVHMNVWATRNNKLAGEFNELMLPEKVEVKAVVLSKWFQPEIINF